eukprot:gene9575-2887_t
MFTVKLLLLGCAATTTSHVDHRLSHSNEPNRMGVAECPPLNGQGPSRVRRPEHGDVQVHVTPPVGSHLQLHAADYNACAASCCRDGPCIGWWWSPPPSVGNPEQPKEQPEPPQQQRVPGPCTVGGVQVGCCYLYPQVQLSDPTPTCLNFTETVLRFGTSTSTSTSTAANRTKDRGARSTAPAADADSSNNSAYFGTSGRAATAPPPPPLPTKETECRLRALALEYAMKLQPEHGSDVDGTGSEAQPFKTASRARNAVRLVRMLRETAAAAEVQEEEGEGECEEPPLARAPAAVYFKPGVYYFRKTLELGPEDSDITFAAAPGTAAGAVVLSGGVHFKQLEWKPAGGLFPSAVHVANVGAGRVRPDRTGFTTLYVNNTRRWRARAPNGNPERDLIPENMVPPTSKTLWVQPGPPAHPGIQVSIEGGDAGRDRMTPTRNSTDQVKSGMRNFYSRLVGGYAERFEDGILDGPPRAWSGGCDGLVEAGPKYINGTDTGRCCTPTAPAGVVYDPKHFSTKHWHQHTASNKSSSGITAATKPVLWCMNSEFFSSLQWEVDSLNSTAERLMFGRGGNQCGQNSNRCNMWYVENVLEECDSPGEFFYDNRTGELYYYMNSTAEAQDPGTDYVGSNIEMLVRASGTSAATPIKNVRFSNITFAHTASTFLSSYSTKLGGGDYAVHNGAAVWVSKSEGFRLDGCLFDRVGGTAVMLYGYIRGAVIDSNEFFSTGAHAIVSLYIYPEYISVLDGAGDHSAARGRLASARDMLARTRTEMLHKSRAAAGVASNAAAAAAAAAAGLTEIERLPFCCESLQTNSSEHSGEGDSWINNTCITTVGTPYLFDPSPCNGTRLFPNLAGNTFQVPRNHLLHFPVCNGSLQNGDASLAKWQLMVNQDGSAADAGSHYGPIPSDDALIAKAKALLQF